MAALAPAYTPRRPTETVLYALVRQHLESFLAHAREHYDGWLPRYVEQELRAFLKCGQFSEGFTRAHCDACGHARPGAVEHGVDRRVHDAHGALPEHTLDPVSTERPTRQIRRRHAVERKR